MRHAVHCDFSTSTPKHNNITPVETVPPLNLLDLELLNNFISSTSTTLSNDPTIRNLWKTAIVRKALTSDFVMRALLAVSATHIAAYRSTQKHHYLSHGMAYHDIASRQAIMLMQDMRQEDMEDLYIFSVLTVYFGKWMALAPRFLHSNVGDFATNKGMLTDDTFTQRWEAREITHLRPRPAAICCLNGCFSSTASIRLFLLFKSVPTMASCHR